MKGAWQDVNRAHKCPICQKRDWCRYLGDGERPAIADCYRGNAGGEARVDANGNPFRRYRLNGHVGALPELPATPSAPRADVPILDRVYRAWLEALALTSSHRQALRARGLPDEVIDRNGYRSWPVRGRVELVRRLLDQFGADTMARIPGFRIKEMDGRRYPTLTGGRGLLIPVRTAGACVVALSVRVDDPGEGARYHWVSSAKHGGPGPGAPIHVPLYSGDTERACLTEGCLKADVTTHLSRVLTLGCGGLPRPAQCLPLLNSLHVRRPDLAIDADAARKWGPAQALLVNYQAYQKAGLTVTLQTWNEADGKGIDDLRANGKEPRELTGAAASAEVLRIVGEARKNDPHAPSSPTSAEAALEVEALLEALQQTPDATQAFNHIEALAALERKDYSQAKIRLKKILRGDLNLNDLDAEVRDARHRLARARSREAVAEQPPHPAADAAPPPDDGVCLADFRAYMPEHRYIYIPNGELWPAASVDARLPGIPTGAVDDDGKPKLEKPAHWLDRNQPVEQMTWAPGEPVLILDRLIVDGGWLARPGCTVFNLYQPPVVTPGDPGDVTLWWNHLVTIYGEESARHILAWLAHRVQRPGEKINHALVLGGAQGIGKDTILDPIKTGIGPWNFAEVSPVQLLGRFNSFVKSVILRVSEARDLGDVDRFAFYEHTKVYTAAPPDVLRCDEKNLREYAVRNVCGVILTTNHQLGGIYLPTDDRRHFVAWSECVKEQFSPEYWVKLWRWYEAGGRANVAAYLRAVDITAFDPKAPPPKTEAFYQIVNAQRAPEDGELADALELLKNPPVVSKELLLASDLIGLDFKEWLRDRRNARQVPHRLDQLGYAPVRNEGQTDGRWKVAGKNVVLYVRKALLPGERIVAARQFAEAARP